MFLHDSPAYWLMRNFVSIWDIILLQFLKPIQENIQLFFSDLGKPVTLQHIHIKQENLANNWIQKIPVIIRWA